MNKNSLLKTIKNIVFGFTGEKIGNEEADILKDFLKSFLKDIEKKLTSKSTTNDLLLLFENDKELFKIGLNAINNYKIVIRNRGNTPDEN